MSESTSLVHVTRFTVALAAAWALGAQLRGQSEPAEAAAAPGGSPLAGSEWHVLGGGSALFTYDDNPFIAPYDRTPDSYWQLAPTIAAGLGDFAPEVLPYADIPHFLVQTDTSDVPDRNLIFLRYTPDFEWWDRFHQNDTVNEDVQAEARMVTERLDLAANLRVQSVTSPDIDVGNRLRQSYGTADVTAQYALTGRTDVGAELVDNRSTYQGGLASNEADGRVFADYAIAPKTAVGIGLSYGGLTVSGGPSQRYWQPVVRWSYTPTDKLAFTGDAGVEYRSFEGTRGRSSDGIFNLTGRYDATDSTEFTLTGQRHTTASALYATADIDETVVQAQVRQRLVHELYATLSGGLARDAYYASVAGAAYGRVDNYGFWRLGAAHDLTRHGTVEVSYEHRNNDSTIAAFGFVENLAEAEASFLF